MDSATPTPANCEAPVQAAEQGRVDAGQGMVCVSVSMKAMCITHIREHPAPRYLLHTSRTHSTRPPSRTVFTSRSTTPLTSIPPLTRPPYPTNTPPICVSPLTWPAHKSSVHQPTCLASTPHASTLSARILAPYHPFVLPSSHLACPCKQCLPVQQWGLPPASAALAMPRLESPDPGSACRTRRAPLAEPLAAAAAPSGADPPAAAAAAAPEPLLLLLLLLLLHLLMS